LSGAALRRGWVLLRHRLSKTFLPIGLPPSLDRDAPFGFEFRAREHASHLSGGVTAVANVMAATTFVERRR
jgi:hypothetical protein